MKKFLRIEFSQINQFPSKLYDSMTNRSLKPYKVDQKPTIIPHINQSSLVGHSVPASTEFSEDIKEILSDKDHFQLPASLSGALSAPSRGKENLEKQIQEKSIFRSGARIYGEKQSEQRTV